MGCLVAQAGIVACLLLLTGWKVNCQWLDPSSPYSGYQTEYSRPNADLDLHLDEPDIAPNPLGGPEQVFLSQADDVGTAFTHNTRYYYKIGSGTEEFIIFEGDFLTPPAPQPDIPFAFSIVGDLGQTYSSNITLDHLERSGGQALLNVGDFSYADGYQPRWDTWGRMVTRYTSKIPMLFTYGNHEIEFDKAVGAVEPHEGFLSANSRFSAPWKTSGAVSPIYYSCNVGPAHIISLNSYISMATYSPQFEWLQADLKKVDRSVTPWIFIITHVPWYNSYEAHYLEGEVMRTALEYTVRKHQVDAIFSGHVHAYERFRRVYLYREDHCAPLYITIGDGGNREGPAQTFQVNPQPEISAYREGSFGYGTLEIFNSSVALWKWHRNQDQKDVVADVLYLTNLHKVNCTKPAVPSWPTYAETATLQTTYCASD
ncbi:hypothetical protein O6H91_03G023600 [Diphasiastrum complanatum]|uniref:Uncharacterized protein n=1 Tax=Diphasiastrum complanatum TaxID=34168 RepID=A0ACC2E4A6_DIPCM|nr:hypothetical protein O6H91_03G023600 [Diphasiastrum complanatum]